MVGRGKEPPRLGNWEISGEVLPSTASSLDAGSLQSKGVLRGVQKGSLSLGGLFKKNINQNDLTYDFSTGKADIREFLNYNIRFVMHKINISFRPRLLKYRLAIPQQPIRLQQVRDVIPRNKFDFSLRLTRILALFKCFFWVEEDFLERNKVSWLII